jgi:hypothetical protein
MEKPFACKKMAGTMEAPILLEVYSSCPFRSMPMSSPSEPDASPLTKPETVPVTAPSPKPLRKLWLLIFAVVVGCLLLYGLKDRVAWAQRADEPEAYALLIVEKQDSRFPFDKQEKESDTDFDRYLHAQVVNLKNRSTLNRALNKSEPEIGSWVETSL